MQILAVDPGTDKSAYVIYETQNAQVVEKGIENNKDLLKLLAVLNHDDDVGVLVIEMMKSYGNVMGDTVLETCVWIGRFIERWARKWEWIYRKTIVTQLCNSSRAKDSNVRQALIDRYRDVLRARGVYEDPVGLKSSPGPLYGVKKDMWSALAVAVAYHERSELE